MSFSIDEVGDRLRSPWSRVRARSQRAARAWVDRPSPVPADDRFVDPTRAAAVLEQILTDNVVPFWSGVVDHDHGGYRLHHDRDGRWLGPAPRHLVTQARTTWYFARLSRSPWGTDEDLAAAKHGAAFLLDAHRDDVHGGYHWTVEPTGRRPIERAKVVYGQAFALFAFSELAATGDTGAAAAATELAELLDRHARDRRAGGYVEFLADDWSLPSSDAANPRVPVSPGWKTRDTHLHVLEALSSYHRVVEDAAVADRMRELVTALSMSFRSPFTGLMVEHCTAGWEAALPARDEVVSYGHDLEAIWLLDDAVRQLGDPPDMLLSQHRRVFEHALRHGIDRRRGGVAYSGAPSLPASRRERSWWVQAESLVSCLAMARLTGEQRYVDVFSAMLGWIVDHQVDWERGEWFEWVLPGGRPSGVKAGAWKGPYHSGRSMLECLERLAALGG